MADQLIRIKIPNEAIEVPKNEIKAPVNAGEIVVISLEPANGGDITISESGDGIYIRFKKWPFETGDVIITPGG